MSTESDAPREWSRSELDEIWRDSMLRWLDNMCRELGVD